MSNIICCIVFTFFAIWGISDFILWITKQALNIPHTNNASPHVILVEGCKENIEYRLRSAIFEALKNCGDSRIIVKIKPSDTEAVAICRLFVKDYPGVITSLL